MEPERSRRIQARWTEDKAAAFAGDLGDLTLLAMSTGCDRQRFITAFANHLGASDPTSLERAMTNLARMMAGEGGP